MGAQSDQVKPSILLLYPILATFLAAAWVHSDIRAGAIGQYIKTQIEGRVEIRGLQWESYLEEQFTEQQPGLRAWLVRNVAKRLVEIYAIGIFLSTQLLAIILAGFKMESCCDRSEQLLLILDFIGILLTASLTIIPLPHSHTLYSTIVLSPEGIVNRFTRYVAEQRNIYSWNRARYQLIISLPYSKKRITLNLIFTCLKISSL